MTEYEELRAAGLTDHNIQMLRNTGASHAAILAFAKRIDGRPRIVAEPDGLPAAAAKGVRR